MDDFKAAYYKHQKRNVFLEAENIQLRSELEKQFAANKKLLETAQKLQGNCDWYAEEIERLKGEKPRNGVLKVRSLDEEICTPK